LTEIDKCPKSSKPYAVNEICSEIAELPKANKPFATNGSLAKSCKMDICPKCNNFVQNGNLAKMNKLMRNGNVARTHKTF